MANDEPAQPAILAYHNWSSRSHRELFESVHLNNDPGHTETMAGEWVTMGAQIGESAQLIAETLRANEADWHGEAAAQARGAMMKLSTWSETTSQTAIGVGARLADQAQIVQAAKNAMPEPVDFDWHAMLTMGFLTGGLPGFAAAVNDVKVASDKANAAHQQAVQVMTVMESESREVDANVPTFTKPPNPVRGETTPMQADAPGTQPSLMLRDSLTGTSPQYAEMRPFSYGTPPEMITPSPMLKGPDGMPVPGGVGPSGFGPGGVSPGGVAARNMPGVDSPTVRHMPTVPSSVNPPEIPAPQTGPQGMPNIPDPGATKRMPVVPPGGSFGPGPVNTKPQGMPDIPGFGGPGSGNPGFGGPGFGGPGPGTSRTTTPQGSPTIPNISIPPGARPGQDNDPRRQPPPPKMPPFDQGPGPQRGMPDIPGGRIPPVPGGPGPMLKPPPGGMPPIPPAGIKGGLPPIPGGGGPGGGPGGGGFGPGGAGNGGGGTGSALGAGQVGGQPADERGFGPRGGAAPGQPGSPGGSGMGAGAKGKGDDDAERKSKYVDGEQLFQVPGGELPPSVIGGGKQPKKQG
jgi:hypothetical protein